MLKGVLCLDMLFAREEFKLMHIGPLLYDQLGIEAKVENVCVYVIFIEKLCLSQALVNYYVK
jgi:hypothetical protein